MRHSPRPRLHLALALTLPACTGEPDPAHTSTGEPPPASTSSASSTSTATPGDPTTGELATATTDAGATTEVSTAAATGTSVPDLGDHLPSRCSETARSIVCPKTTVELGPWQRDVHFQVPLGEPPPAGWPAVLMFQGSFFSAEITWNATPELPFGAYWQTLVVKRLLDHGYAVITPEAKLGGGTFWDTNVPPWSLNWESSEDHALMLEIFAQIDASTFGPIDAAALHATGVSSGGYMSSRVALAYPGRFRSIAIASAAYMTCSGPLCDIPELPPEHPPTLLMHGEVDLTVPVSTAKDYYTALLAAEVDARLVLDPAEGHGWLPVAPDEVLQWFTSHP